MQIKRASLPLTYLVTLPQVNCEGTETALAQCPGSDTYTCLSPGAGLICPTERALSTTSSFISTTLQSETTTARDSGITTETSTPYNEKRTDSFTGTMSLDLVSKDAINERSGAHWIKESLFLIAVSLVITYNL